MCIIQNGARCTSQHNDNYGYHIITSYHIITVYESRLLLLLFLLRCILFQLLPEWLPFGETQLTRYTSVALPPVAPVSPEEYRPNNDIGIQCPYYLTSGRASAPSVSRSAHPYPSSPIRVWGQRGDRRSGNPSPTYTQGVLTSTLVLRSPVIVITTLSIAQYSYTDIV